ncbi:hypothetical protein ACWFQ8_28035 [Streptomyces sp. NPDC055254]
MISARKGTLLLASIVLGGSLALVPAAAGHAAPAAAYSCNEYVSNGYLYMGNSTTMTTNTTRGQTGPRVAEVQCLLEFWSWYFQAPEFDPQGHDGSFGPITHTRDQATRLSAVSGSSACRTRCDLRSRHLFIDGRGMSDRSTQPSHERPPQGGSHSLSPRPRDQKAE